jgi:hypothetical protein
MVLPPRAGPRGGLRRLHLGGPMGGAKVVSVPRSTGTAVAAVASAPSPSSPAAAAFTRWLLVPMPASEEAAAAAGLARRLLVGVDHNRLATRQRPRGPLADRAGGPPGAARGALPPSRGQAQPPNSWRRNDTTVRVRGALGYGRWAPARAGPERRAEAQVLAFRAGEPGARRVQTASRTRRVVTQAASEGMLPASLVFSRRGSRIKSSSFHIAFGKRTPPRRRRRECGASVLLWRIRHGPAVIELQAKLKLSWFNISR